MNANRLEISDKLNGPVEEAYISLRTNIQFCSFDRKLKSIAVTSTNPGEGKTTTSTNLAMSFAKSGIKVLLVDADLRKPMIGKGMAPKDALGLSNFLSGMISFDEAIHETTIPNFSIVLCGHKPPNPAELLGSDNFKEFIRIAEEKFDIVIFDTPPLGSVIDCAIISALIDGVIIVIETNAIEYQKAQKVKEQLEKANARILGVVLNKMQKSEYQYYYNYYDYYSGTKKTKTKKRVSGRGAAKI